MEEDTIDTPEIIESESIGEAVENLIEQKIEDSTDNGLNDEGEEIQIENLSIDRFTAIESWLDGLQTKIEGFETWISTQTQLLTATQDQIKMVQELLIQQAEQIKMIVQPPAPDPLIIQQAPEPEAIPEPVVNDPEPEAQPEPEPEPDYSKMRQKHRPKEARDYL